MLIGKLLATDKKPPLLFPGVYIEEVPPNDRNIPAAATSITAFMGSAPANPADKPVSSITRFEEYQQVFGDVALKSPLGYAVKDFFNNGGLQAVVINTPQNAITTDGFALLKNAGLFNSLCILPPTRHEDVAPTIYQAALRFCSDHNALLIVDPPRTWSATTLAAAVANVKNGLAGLGLSGAIAKNAALYFPRIRQADPLQNNAVDLFPPCGVMAGIMARTDVRRGVWKAPAGTEATLLGVQGLEYELTSKENNLLNPLGVNCLRPYPGRGLVAWGARTLAGTDQQNSEYKYIPVLRTAQFIRNSWRNGMAWAAFESNDEPLWANTRQSMSAFLSDIFRQGGFVGRTAAEAYFIKCDRETQTTPGYLTAVVGFAPLKPAEFVILRLQTPAAVQ